MQPEIKITADGSHTIAAAGSGITYHSTHGALQESMHVFINAGLRYVLARNPTALNILEVGLGTGLNALLTLKELAGDTVANYHALELHPLPVDIALQLNYAALPGNEHLAAIFAAIHHSEWGSRVALAQSFLLRKHCCSVLEFESDMPFDLIYYDAFAPADQPELWTQAVFERIFSFTAPGGVLVTYCAKGNVRRALQAAGFAVEKLAGPPGKREMLRATRA